MATSWDKLGQAASLMQLTGVDALGLVSMILQAAHTARRNKDLCQQLAEKVQVVSDLLGDLQIPELRRHPSTRRPLDQLDEALLRAYRLVRSCSQQQKKQSQLQQMLRGDDVASKLRLAKEEIDGYIILIPMITTVAVVKARQGTQEVPEDVTDIQLQPKGFDYLPKKFLNCSNLRNRRRKVSPWVGKLEGMISIWWRELKMDYLVGMTGFFLPEWPQILQRPSHVSFGISVTKNCGRRHMDSPRRGSWAMLRISTTAPPHKLGKVVMPQHGHSSQHDGDRLVMRYAHMGDPFDGHMEPLILQEPSVVIR